jgi:hypothetical protein
MYRALKPSYRSLSAAHAEMSVFGPDADVKPGHGGQRACIDKFERTPITDDWTGLVDVLTLMRSTGTVV